MAIFKNRFTAQDTLLVFVACAFPVHVWAIVNLLNAMPGWILRFDAWDLVGVIGYSLSFALLESLLLFSVGMLAGFFLPARWLKDCVACISTAVFIAVAGTIGLYLSDVNLGFWSTAKFVLVGGGYLFVAGISFFAIHRFQKLAKIIRAVINRLVVLSMVYVFFDLLGVLIVIIRNMT
ncbi:MAG: hypothetical protein ACE5GO_05215 [Anaerolineales bacterium]